MCSGLSMIFLIKLITENQLKVFHELIQYSYSIVYMLKNRKGNSMSYTESEISTLGSSLVKHWGMDWWNWMMYLYCYPCG
ncbi:hypothetical protein FKM82_021745 [Ascaphus truei]